MTGYLALAGIPPFAGFWSKDEILADAFGHGHYIVWIVLTLASFLTAFYMTRQVMVVFFGNFRGHNPRVATHPSEPTAVEHAHGTTTSTRATHAHGGHDPHESPWTMTLPLIILAVFAVLARLREPARASTGLSSFFGQEAGAFNFVTAGIATVLALAGIGLGWSLYRNAFATADRSRSAGAHDAGRVPGAEPQVLLRRDLRQHLRQALVRAGLGLELVRPLRARRDVCG